jgi:nucleotide-binding universal stress UspA family protein
MMHEVPKNILAATDFSETADKAGGLARELARRFEAHLHVLHAVILLDDPHLEKERRNQLEEILTGEDEARRRALEESYEEQHGIEITPHMVRGIAPGEVIVESAGNFGCDLIIMGTHGRRGLSHLLLGSVAERVVRTSKIPVLTSRVDADINPEGISKILVPHDFSEASDAAVRQAVAWAEVLGAKVTLFHVVEPVVYPEFYSVDVMSEELMDSIVVRSEDALKEAADALEGNVPTNTRVEVGRAAETIVDFADPDEFDLVIMATRGLSGLEHVLLGSVAESVLRRCRVPMLAIPGS